MTADTAKISTATRIVRRPAGTMPRRVSADICVLGAGIAGVSAALEAARLGRRVALVDGLPALGGQAVNSIIGTFCGLFANGTHGHQLTHGIADDILRELGAQGALHYRRGGPSNTTVVMYDEVALSRWIEEAVRKADITVLLGAILRGVTRDGGSSARSISPPATATCARGDRLRRCDRRCRPDMGSGLSPAASRPAVRIYGTQMMVLEGIDEAEQPSREELVARLREKAADYGLVRTRRICLRRFPAAAPRWSTSPMSRRRSIRWRHRSNALLGKAQADGALHFLKSEYPEGLRQGARAQLRPARHPPDALDRTAASSSPSTTCAPAPSFPTRSRAPPGRSSCTTARKAMSGSRSATTTCTTCRSAAWSRREADNIVAVGRCIDGDTAALSSVRVMGPCIAMGAAAAHALDLAGSGSVQQIDIAALRKRVRDNVE